MLRSPLALLEARTEALACRWGEVIRTLRPIASGTFQPRLGGNPPSMSAARCSMAEAYEMLDQPDSAAMWLETVTSDPAPAFQELPVRGIFLPFARRRLVILYSRMGRIEAAR